MAGGRFHGAVSVHGRQLAEASVHLTGPAEAAPFLHTVPLVHTRYFPHGEPAEPPVAQLVTSVVDGVQFGPVWSGRADLRFLDTQDEDLALLRPIEVGRGHVFSYAETLRHGRVLSTPDRCGT